MSCKEKVKNIMNIRDKRKKESPKFHKIADKLVKNQFLGFKYDKPYHVFRFRVVPDTNLAGYPANNFAGYRISGLAGYRISGLAG